MVHIIRYCLPGPGPGVAERLERALARAGRSVTARRPLEGPESSFPRPEPGTLRWQVRSLPAEPVFDDDFNVLDADEPDPTFLLVEERTPGGERWSDEGWDLTLCRELSAEAGGFVCAMDGWDYIGRRGVAMFLAGRTVEVWETTLTDGLRKLGGRPPAGWEPGWYCVGDVHERHTSALLDTYGYHSAGVVTHCEEWSVTPAGPFHAEPVSPVCLVVLPGTEQPPGGPYPPGLRVRAGRVAGRPYTVLGTSPGREGRLADLDLAALSAGVSQPIVGLEMPGAGEPFAWAHAHAGEITATGRGQGGDDLLTAVRPLGDAPGLFFGR